MSGVIDLSDPAVEVTLKPNPRARRLTLRISQATGAVTLTMPRGTSRRVAEGFLHANKDWLRTHLARQPEPLRPAFGVELSIEGALVRIVPSTGRAVRRDGASLLIPGTAEGVPGKLRAYLRHLARDRLVEASGRYTATLGLRMGTISLRDTRSRWGSCSTAGNLMFSWRLIMAPPAVLEYVAAHEVAHRIEMNHAPAFWQVLARLMPDYATHRKWLRVHGVALHRLVF